MKKKCSQLPAFLLSVTEEGASWSVDNIFWGEASCLDIQHLCGQRQFSVVGKYAGSEVTLSEFRCWILPHTIHGVVT